MDIKLKIMFSALFLIVIFLAGIAIASYLNISKHISGSGDSAPADSYRVFVGDNGKYGVRNANNEEIIPSQWNNIMLIDNGRLVVENSNSVKAIVDFEQNFILPFVIEGVVHPSPDLLIITTTGGKYLLCSISGELLSDTLWDFCEYIEGTLNLKVDSSSYIAELNEDGQLLFKNISVNHRLLGTNISASFTPTQDIPNIDNKDYLEMLNLSFDYIEALFNADIKGNYFTVKPPDILSGRLLYNCIFKQATDFLPIINMDNGKILYTCSFVIIYSEKTADGSASEIEMKQNITLEFNRATSGELLINTVK